MSFLDALWKYLIASSPYLLFGLFISGATYQFLTVDRIKKWLGGKSFLNVVKAALIGVPLPLCSCSVIPTAVTIRKSGASKAATSSFLIATPESGIDSISLTYALMGLPMAIIRPIAAFLSAFLAGALQLLFNTEDSLGIEKQEHSTPSCKKNCSKPVANKSFFNKFIDSFKYGFGNLLNDISLWLAIGIIAGALIEYLVPQNFFLSLSPTQSRMAILIVGIPLYICATASTPIALSLILKGMSPGVALILLLVGPATNISNIAVLQKYIGKKGILLNIIAIIIVALIMSYVVDYFFLETFQGQGSFGQLHQHENISWWEKASAITLSLLIIKGVYIENLRPLFSKEKSCHNH